MAETITNPGSFNDFTKAVDCSLEDAWGAYEQAVDGYKKAIGQRLGLSAVELHQKGPEEARRLLEAKINGQA